MHKKNFDFRCNIQIVILIFFTVFVVLRVFLNSYMLKTYVSPDSGQYLREAQALLNGNGLRINQSAGDVASYFAAWPIGYPLTIALVASALNVNTYLASKILSILIIIIIAVLLYKHFHNDAWLYSIIFINTGFLLIFEYTWSEQIFILGLIWHCFEAHNLLQNETISNANLIRLGISGYICFLSRYIGAFTLCSVLTFIYLHYLLYHRKNILLKGVLIIVLFSSFIFGYLIFNYLNTGFFTGVSRRPVVDTIALFSNLINAQLKELNGITGGFLAFSPLGCAVLWLIWLICVFVSIKKYKLNIMKTYGGVFTFVGILYWVFIVFMRFRTQMDAFGSRFLAPSTILLSLGGINYALEKHFISKCMERFAKQGYLVILCLFFVTSCGNSVSTILSRYTKQQQIYIGYSYRYNIITERYKDIESGSIVAFSRASEYPEALFIRDDIQFFLPVLGASEAEVWNRTLSKAEENTTPVYIDVVGLSKYAESKECPEEVKNYYKTLPDIDFIKINLEGL